MHSQIVAASTDGRFFLMINELPNYITYLGTSYISKPLTAYSGLLGTEQSDMNSLTYCLNDAIKLVFNISQFCLMTIGCANSAFTSAICKSKLQDSYRCFDPHCRTAVGTFSNSGKSVVLCVQSVGSLITYVVELSKSLFGNARYQSVPFELTPVICEPQSTILPSALALPSTSADSTTSEFSMSPIKGDNTSSTNDMQSKKTGDEPKPDLWMGTEILNHDDDDICPNVCSRDQFRNWQASRPWLRAKRLVVKGESVIGVTCSICSEVGSIANCKSLSLSHERLSISSEWMCGVTATNSKKLHDKMSQHASSKAHIICQEELKNRSTEQLQKSLQKSRDIWRAQNSARIDETCRVFRTVYVIAWKQLSFRTHPYLFDMQKQNGVQLGRILHSHKVCSRITQFIATEMRQRLIDYVISTGSLFSLMMDESTTMANETALIIYLRAPDPSGNY